MGIIKCNICRLDKETCDYQCVGMEDVSTLYKEGTTEKDAIPDRFCTLHNCPHNPSGFHCESERCFLDK